jgi:hypothetical protein
MKKLFLIIVSLALPPASALAADLQLPFKSPAETFSWTGFMSAATPGARGEVSGSLKRSPRRRRFWLSTPPPFHRRPRRHFNPAARPPARRPVTIINGAIGSSAARWISSISACAASTPATSPSRVLCPAVRWDRPPHFHRRPRGRAREFLADNRNIGAVYGNLGLCDDPRWLDRRRRYRIRNRTQLVDPRRVSPCRPRHGEYGGNAHAALSGAHPYGLGSLDDRDCARRTQLSLLSLSPRAPIALMSAPTLRGSAIPGELQACERKPAASRARGWGDLRFATIRRYSAKLRIADLRLRTAFGVNTGTAFGASQCSA